LRHIATFNREIGDLRSGRQFTDNGGFANSGARSEPCGSPPSHRTDLRPSVTCTKPRCGFRRLRLPSGTSWLDPRRGRGLPGKCPFSGRRVKRGQTSPARPLRRGMAGWNGRRRRFLALRCQRAGGADLRRTTPDHPHPRPASACSGRSCLRERWRRRASRIVAIVGSSERWLEHVHDAAFKFVVGSSAGQGAEAYARQRSWWRTNSASNRSVISRIHQTPAASPVRASAAAIDGVRLRPAKSVLVHAHWIEMGHEARRGVTSCSGRASDGGHHTTCIPHRRSFR
jgi:hypothetical protein